MALFGRRKQVTPPMVRPPAQREPSDRAPWALRVMSDWSWRLLVVGLFLAAILWLLYQVKVVAIAFIVGVLVTALLFPFVAALNRIGFPRLLSTVTVFVVGLGVLVGVGFFVGNQVSRNALALREQVLDVVAQGEDWLANGPLQVDAAQIAELTARLQDAIKTNWQEIATGAVTGLGTTVEVVGGVILAAFSVFFLLHDGPQMWAWFTAKVSEGPRTRLREAGAVAWRTISHYVRGTVVIAFTDAVAVTITLLIAGVPLAVPVGVLVFLGAFVPILGLAITGALAVALALISKGLIVAVVVLGVIVLAVQVEGHVLQPIVMSRAVRVHPLAVILAVTAGTFIAGIFGAVIAVPLVAVLNNMLTSKVIDFSPPQRRTGRRWRRQRAGAESG
ncbi:MAG: AI-2E family transporter [Streptosporangiales bacterium]|nr:AI-2E family transporter [Streptosporangiales bacterium]